MIYYLSLYGFSLFVFFLTFDKHTVSVNNKILALLFAVPLIIICGFRYGIGTDYWSYHGLYVGTHQDLKRMEPGFKSLISISKFLFPQSFSFFVFLFAFISVFLKTYYFAKLKNPFFAILIYICLFYIPLDFNGIRQGLATCFIYFAIEQGRKKHLFEYVFFVFLACLFHFTALIFLPFYPLCYKKFKFKLKSLIIIFVFFIILRITILPLLFDSFKVFVLSKFSSPVIRQLGNYFTLFDFTLSLNFLRRLVFLIAYIMIFGTKDLDCYFIFYLFSFFISTILTGNEIFAYRLSLWFDIFAIPLFASRKINFTNKNAVVLIGFILVLTVLFFSFMQDGLPYQTTSWEKI